MLRVRLKVQTTSSLCCRDLSTIASFPKAYGCQAVTGASEQELSQHIWQSYSTTIPRHAHRSVHRVYYEVNIMPSSFTSSKQSASIPQAGQMESGLYDQLNLSQRSASGKPTNQNTLQRALQNPHETLLQLQQTWQPQSSPWHNSGCWTSFGADFMQRFNAGGVLGWTHAQRVSAVQRRRDQHES